MTSKRNFSRYNPIALGLSAMMFLYQNVISSQLSSNCPYELTCSNFSKSAITEFGWIKGMALSADRLLRCNHAGTSEISSVYITEKGKFKDFPYQYRNK